MTKERFIEVLKAAGIVNEHALEALWDTRPTDDLVEVALTAAAKDILVDFPRAGIE